MVVSNHDHVQDDDDDDDNDSENDTVGSLLADVATALNDAIRLLRFADKRHWASDEFAQVRALEDALDEAKADFQELGPLLRGTFYYENDRRRMYRCSSLFCRHRHFVLHHSCATWVCSGSALSRLVAFCATIPIPLLCS